MGWDNEASGLFSFRVQSGETRYPLNSTTVGTATDTASSAITRTSISIVRVIVENSGSADGTLTLSDHAGTAGTAIVINLPTLATSQQFREYGIAVPWVGLRAVLTGTAIICRVVWTSGR